MEAPCFQGRAKGSTRRLLNAESPPINNTRWRRHLTLLARKVLFSRPLRRFAHSSGPVLFVSNKICIKSSGFTQLAEAHAMEFVRMNTSIPVPKVYCAFEHGGRAYIAMERLPGHYIGEGYGSRSRGSKDNLLDQLKRHVDQLQLLTPPPGAGVSNVKGGAFFDPRLGNENYWGPFATVADFHLALRNDIASDVTLSNKEDEFILDLKQILNFHERHDNDSLRFAHADLTSLNILVEDDLITGIVDWEMAGWFPSHWEHAQASNGDPANWSWINEILKCFPEDPEVPAVQKKWIVRFGAFG